MNSCQFKYEQVYIEQQFGRDVWRESDMFQCLKKKTNKIWLRSSILVFVPVTACTRLKISIIYLKSHFKCNRLAGQQISANMKNDQQKKPYFGQLLSYIGHKTPIKVKVTQLKREFKTCLHKGNT